MVDSARPFTRGDFLVLEPSKQRDPAFNDSRRIVRARLAALAKLAAAEIKKHLGIVFESKTSLNHPYTFNGFRVDALWFTLFRGKKERAALQEILGQEFSDELDPSYFQALLFGELRLDHFSVGIRINEKAWWDTQNLQRVCRQSPHVERLSAALLPLAGYSLRIHDWQKLYPCETLTPGMLQTFAQWLKPGEHRVTLSRNWPAESPELAAADWPQRLAAELERLVPAWRALAWSGDNDLVFAKKPS